MHTHIDGDGNIVAGGNVINNLMVKWPRLSGAIRVVVGLALLFGLAGFAAWGYFVLSFVLEIFGIVAGGFARPGISGPPVLHIPNPAWLAVGAVLMFAAIVLFAVGGFAATASTKDRASDPQRIGRLGGG